jgi:hypothetical protein
MGAAKRPLSSLGMSDSTDLHIDTVDPEAWLGSWTAITFLGHCNSVPTNSTNKNGWRPTQNGQGRKNNTSKGSLKSQAE